jgi:ribonuclease P protein component
VAATPPLGVWRLSGREDFARLRREGRRARSGPLWVQRAAPAVLDVPPRCAYAIGRAVGGAVVRNRLRRRIRAVLATVVPPLPVGDYLIGATPAAVELTTADLRVHLAAAIGQLVPSWPTAPVEVSA